MITFNLILSPHSPSVFFVNLNNFPCKRFVFFLPQIDKEKIDPRGRTPLMLAVKLAHIQCVKILLAAKCSATYEYEGWSSKLYIFIILLSPEERTHANQCSALNYSCPGSCLYGKWGNINCHFRGTWSATSCAKSYSCSQTTATFAGRSWFLYRNEMGVYIMG